MKIFANILVVFGFCLATLGAAGFHSPAQSANQKTVEVSPGEEPPAREQQAAFFFAGGLALLLAGGFLLRISKRKGEDAQVTQLADQAKLMGHLTEVQEALASLSSRGETLPDPDLHREISEVSEGPVYDLTSQYERWTQVLGFDRYSKVWTGVATGERLVNRAWSMLTDGHGSEARHELVLAHQAFGEAKEQLSRGQ